MAKIYLETSFVSACVTTRTDAASVYRRDTSQEWWHTQGCRHDLYVSQEVLLELSAPAYPRSAEALGLIHSVPLIGLTQDVLGLATVLVRERVMPAPVAGDAIHIAAATVHRMDYVLSWNVRHLANPNKLLHLSTICLRAGYVPPRIVTPELLWETDNETEQ